MKHQSGYAFTLLLLLAGCGGGGSSSDESGTTQLNLAVSDAPVDSAQQVCIAVSALSLKQEGVTDEKTWGPLSLIDTDDNDGCLPDGYTIPKDENNNPTFFYLDLLQYQNGAKHALLSGAVIPSGTYEQLRLQVEDGRTSTLADETGATTEYPASYVKDADGAILPLEVPSSEVKLHSFTAPVNGVLDYQVEFNLRHAMVLPGHEEYYKLKPNGVELLNVEVLSTISGTVATSATNCGENLSKAGVYVYNSDVTTYAGLDADPTAGGPVLTSLVATDGTYQINYVEPGTYQLALVCNAADDVPTDDGSSSFEPIIVEPATEITVQDPAVSGTTAIIANF